MQLSKENIAEMLQVWRDRMAENPNADAFVILRRIARSKSPDEKEQAEIVSKVSAQRTAERLESWQKRRTIAIGIIKRSDFSGRDLAAGAEVEARHDARSHDMLLEG
jgi:hypothetical protein